MRVKRKRKRRKRALTLVEFARMGGYAKARATTAEDKRLSGQKGAAVRWANQRAREQQAREKLATLAREKLATLARDIDAQLAAMGDVKTLDDIEI